MLRLAKRCPEIQSCSHHHVYVNLCASFLPLIRCEKPGIDALSNAKAMTQHLRAGTTSGEATSLPWRSLEYFTRNLARYSYSINIIQLKQSHCSESQSHSIFLRAGRRRRSSTCSSIDCIDISNAKPSLWPLLPLVDRLFTTQWTVQS